MIKVIYNKVCGRCVQSEPLTSGMVGQPIEFEYSSDFDGLTLTAVFTNGKTTVDVLNPGDQCVIPHEVLDTVGEVVKVGIYAVRGNELVIPTVYAAVGIVLKGADPSGDTEADPTLPIWAQIQALIGDLADLETEAKNNLVSAINEAAQTGGGANIALRVEGGYIQYTVDGKTWSNLIAVADLKGPQGETGPQGPKGDTGEQGPQGPQGDKGADGKDGVDGITPTIGDNGNWYLGSTDTGKPSRGEQGVKGDKGDKGADGAPGAKGDKGDAFTYSDFTAEQLAALKGEKGNPGSPGKDGTSITISGISESAADGGANTVTFSDGSALKVKNGSKGSAGADGTDGITPHIGENGNWYIGSTDTGNPSRGATGPQGPAGAPGKDGVGMDITGATVGQIAKITAVDASGVPTAWSPVDMPEKLPNPNALTFTGAATGTYDGSAPLTVDIPSGEGGGSGGSVSTNIEKVYSWTADGTLQSNLDSLAIEPNKIYFCEFMVPADVSMSANSVNTPDVYVRIGTVGNTYTGSIVGNVKGKQKYLYLFSKYTFFVNSGVIHIITDRTQLSQNVPITNNYTKDQVYIYSATSGTAILAGTTVNIYKMG